MPFWKCYYHVIWATKHREACLTPKKEQIVFSTIARVATELKSEVFAINGVSDHVHVAVAIPPGVSVAEWVQRCKGASSKNLNEMFPNDDPFKWQTGYGVLSFGKTNLDFVVAYVANQKQHHADNTLQMYMEQTE